MTLSSSAPRRALLFWAYCTFVTLVFAQNALALNYTACGLTSPFNFKTWVGSFVTDSPLFYPKTENELRLLITRAAKVPSCKVRVAGTGGSPDGIVQQKHDRNVVVVNLADLLVKNTWNGVSNPVTGRIRMGAGKTPLDLNAIARPLGWIVPTRPLLKSFTLGGVYMSGSNHGATVNADRMAKQVTALRALLSDGTFVEISGEEKMRVWRGSLGLLGIVVGLEIQLQKDKGILHGYHSESFQSNFTAPAINKFLLKSLQGNDAAHWFYNFWTDKIFALTVNNQGDPSFNYANTAPYFMGMQQQFAGVAKTGLSPLDPFALLGAQGFNGTMIQLAGGISVMAESLLQQSWLGANFAGRDGYMHENGQILLFNNVESFVKCTGDCITDGTVFALLAGTRSILQQAVGFPQKDKLWYPTLLVTWRILTVSSSGMLLENMAPGRYVGMEIEDAKVIFPNGGHAAVFRRLERFWRSVAANPTSHIGKEYGFGQLSCLPDPYPFQDKSIIRAYYSKEVSERFLKEMKQYDPRGLYRAGAALRLLGVNKKTFDPRSALMGQCGSTSWCLEGCCCTHVPTCTFGGVLNKCIPCDSPLL